MKFRRYLAHDCNSSDGFNDGYYIDDKPIECASYENAVQLCMEVLKDRYEFNEDEVEDISHGDGPCLELKTAYFDKDGNELTQEAWEVLDGDDADKSGYTYVCVSAEFESEGD